SIEGGGVIAEPFLPRSQRHTHAAPIPAGVKLPKLVARVLCRQVHPVLVEGFRKDGQTLQRLTPVVAPAVFWRTDVVAILSDLTFPQQVGRANDGRRARCVADLTHLGRTKPPKFPLTTVEDRVSVAIHGDIAPRR